MNWKTIQCEYELGLTTKELVKKFRISFNAIFKAKRLGLFVTRNLSVAGKLSQQRNPRDYAEARKHRSALTNYRADCAFNFALKKYPDEFDFSLIESYGWYKPKNRGDNLTGVSRDHMVSVRYGFDNNIDPKIISHPANCRLTLQSDNVKKYIRNCITYEELLAKIQLWNEKYK